MPQEIHVFLADQTIHKLLLAEQGLLSQTSGFLEFNLLGKTKIVSRYVVVAHASKLGGKADEVKLPNAYQHL
ncbi:hypothetical protein H6F88_02025 [Oculatella sp. FACHB-28]|uniref:hypothetical protein n=1 Tax=Oculatella sp. FACHB-28 TaxID=2692845 RepID=UPI001689DBF9|nr:hypothetical protein [Oculatella sp. FACHB-28]MBD2054812.1 hypothetical protein [Oculatella sp. FACHB-28]